MQQETPVLPRFLIVLLVLFVSSTARADVGLIIENPDGAFGFLTDAGHASVWISHGCLDKRGDVYFCEHSDGIVLTGTGYWSRPGAAAIPAGLYLVGPDAAPVADPTAAWNQTLAATYPLVSPNLGRKYIGRLWHRDVRILVFPTTAEEDRRVLETAQRERSAFAFSFYHHNCAAYAQHVLELYRGPLHVRRWLDLGMTTPRSVELALNASLEDPRAKSSPAPAAPPDRRLAAPLGSEGDPAFSTAGSPSSAGPRLYQFSSTRRQRLRPPRTLCESALLDPKYAVPILVLEPELYPAFACCYVLGRHRGGKEPRPVQVAMPYTTTSSFEARQLATYRAFTGDSAAE